LPLAWQPLAGSLVTGCTTILGPSSDDDNWSRIERSRLRLLRAPGSFAERTSASSTTRRKGACLHDRPPGEAIAGPSQYSSKTQRLALGTGGLAYRTALAVRVVVLPPLDDNLLHVVRQVNSAVAGNAVGRPGPIS
jgi:hypothetical protein